MIAIRILTFCVLFVGFVDTCNSCTAANETNPAQSLFERYTQLKYKGDQRLPLSEWNYSDMCAVAEEALRLARVDGMIWRRYFGVRLQPEPAVGGRPFCELVGDILHSTSQTAPDFESRLLWARRAQEVFARILDDPLLRAGISRLREGRERSFDRANPESVSLVFDYSPEAMVRQVVLRRTGRDVLRPDSLPSQDFYYEGIAWHAGSGIAGSRSLLARHGQLPSGDWGVLAGLEWFHGKENVRFENGTVYLNTRCLTKLGIPVTLRPNGVGLTNGLKTAQVQFGRAAPGKAPSAMRASGKGDVFLDIEELNRQGLYDVSVDKVSQVAGIRAAVPQPEVVAASKTGGDRAAKS